jgi:mono/diheme cytochrome c family protein
MKSTGTWQYGRFALLLVGVVSLASAACGGGPGDSTGSTCPTDSSLTYENFGQAFMRDHCLACHAASAPRSPKLDSVDLVRASKTDIDKSAAAGPNGVNTYMPESGSVSEADRRLLGEWLACGAP